MNRIILTVIIFLTSAELIAQDDPFEQWNKNYTEIDLSEILAFEKSYADSIESNFDDTQQLYFRSNKYRLEATYTGNWRKLSDERKSIMNFVFKMVGIDQGITQTIKKEIELTSTFGNIWMPIQPQLEKPFKKEIPKNSKVYIYAFFLNQHSSRGLTNIFLVSEFKNIKE